ncbi:MAG: hypothetical protein GWP08_00845 [Nitrospiraceae bacterium]|nr:hypothetical protein [Nitrospiraceae bacterium]
MSLRFGRSAPQSGEYGPAFIEGNGLFTLDGVQGVRRLVFDLYLVDYQNRPVTPRNLRAFTPIPKVFFEVRPDLPFSFVGRAVWRGWEELVRHRAIRSPLGPGRALPPYVDATRYLPSASQRPAIFRGLVLSRLRVAVASPYIDWGLKIPQFHLCLGKKVPATLCCLGQDFLKRGVVCWHKPPHEERGHTCFLAPSREQEVWPHTTTFNLPGVGRV